MSDLTEFLLARVAEDEAVANDAYGFIIGSRWWEKTEHGRVYAGHWVPVVGVTSYDEPGPEGEQAVTHQGLGLDSLAHIARHDPARVLAECEAKRHLLDEALVWGEGCLDVTARYMAEVYADHSDYDDAWRP